MRIKMSIIWAVLLLTAEFLPTAIYNYFSLAIILIFLGVLVTEGCSKRILKINNKAAVYYFAATILVYLIHYWGFETFERIIYFVVGIATVRAVVLACVKTESDFENVINIIIIMFTVYALMCLYETFTDFNIFDIIFSRNIEAFGANSTRFGLSRAYGFCTVSINNAMLLNLAWMTAAYRLFNKNKNYLKWTVCYCIIGLAVIMSLSRMVIMLGAGFQCIMAVKCGFGRLLKRIFTVITALILLILLFPNQLAAVRNNAVSMFAPFLVMFDSSYSAYLDSQAQGIGERFILWSWVLGDVKNNLLFGLGYTINFSSMGHYISRGLIKTSVEVYWLTLIFRSGLVGLSGFLAYIISVLLKLRKPGTAVKEGKLSFRSVLFMMTAALILFWFTCSANEELRFFYVLFSLFEAYQVISRRKNIKLRSDKVYDKKKITVGLVGAPLNNENLGCQALAYSTAYLLWKIAEKNSVDLKINLFEISPDDDKCRQFCSKLNIPRSCVSSYKVNFIAIIRSYRKFWKTNFSTILRIRECDFIIDLTEGDSFSDIYGDKRFKELMRTKAMIQRLKSPYISGPQTYGPFNSEKNKLHAAKILMKSDKIFARDKMSADLVKEITGKNAEILADMAFFLPYKKQVLPKSNKVKVGLNISGLLTENNYEGTLKCFELKTDYDKYIGDVLNYLCSDSRFEIYLIPHVKSDYKAIQRFSEEYNNVNAVNTFDNPVDVKSFISSMDIFIGARMHATIAAFTSGVMTIPTAYSRKFKGVFDIVKLDEIVDLLNDGTETSVNKTISLINRMIEKPDLQLKSYSLCEEEKNKTEKIFEGIIRDFID